MHVYSWIEMLLQMQKIYHPAWNISSKIDAFAYLPNNCIDFILLDLLTLYIVPDHFILYMEPSFWPVIIRWLDLHVLIQSVLKFVFYVQSCWNCNFVIKFVSYLWQIGRFYQEHKFLWLKRTLCYDVPKIML
jgi:hypothetical protein